jgi:hypothetical protein
VDGGLEAADENVVAAMRWVVDTNNADMAQRTGRDHLTPTADHA